MPDQVPTDATRVHVGFVSHHPIGYDDDGRPFDCEFDGEPWPCSFVRSFDV